MEEAAQVEAMAAEVTVAVAPAVATAAVAPVVVVTAVEMAEAAEAEATRTDRSRPQTAAREDHNCQTQSTPRRNERRCNHTPDGRRAAPPC